MQGRQFDKVSKLIKVGTEDLEMERAGIVTTLTGFDTHNDGYGRAIYLLYIIYMYILIFLSLSPTTCSHARQLPYMIIERTKMN
jgi:hypothetical protein